jgi:hypothetical protein
MAQAREDALRAERRAMERRAPYLANWQASDEYRVAMRAVHEARRVATAGVATDDEGVWDLLAQAAQAETQAEADLAEVVG